MIMACFMCDNAGCDGNHDPDVCTNCGGRDCYATCIPTIAAMERDLATPSPPNIPDN